MPAMPPPRMTTRLPIAIIPTGSLHGMARDYEDLVASLFPVEVRMADADALAAAQPAVFGMTSRNERSYDNRRVAWQIPRERASVGIRPEVDVATGFHIESTAVSGGEGGADSNLTHPVAPNDQMV